MCRSLCFQRVSECPGVSTFGSPVLTLGEEDMTVLLTCVLVVVGFNTCPILANLSTRCRAVPLLLRF